MKKQRKSSQETILQCWGRVLVPPQGTYITVSLSSSARTKAPTHVEGGNYMLRPQTGWNLKADDWDSWSTTLLPHHQPIRRKSVTLQTSPQILPVKTSPWKSSGSSGDFEHKPPVLLAWLCNKPFSAPSSDVCLYGLIVPWTHELASSFLARTWPVKSCGLFVYYSPPTILSLYKSALLPLP